MTVKSHLLGRVFDLAPVTRPGAVPGSLHGHATVLAPAVVTSHHVAGLLDLLL